MILYFLCFILLHWTAPFVPPVVWDRRFPWPPNIYSVWKTEKPDKTRRKIFVSLELYHR